MKISKAKCAAKYTYHSCRFMIINNNKVIKIYPKYELNEDQKHALLCKYTKDIRNEFILNITNNFKSRNIQY